jgi:hypothetical protein
MYVSSLLYVCSSAGCWYLDTITWYRLGHATRFPRFSLSRSQDDVYPRCQQLLNMCLFRFYVFRCVFFHKSSIVHPGGRGCLVTGIFYSGPELIISNFKLSITSFRLLPLEMSLPFMPSRPLCTRQVKLKQFAAGRSTRRMQQRPDSTSPQPAVIIFSLENQTHSHQRCIWL